MPTFPLKLSLTLTLTLTNLNLNSNPTLTLTLTLTLCRVTEVRKWTSVVFKKQEISQQVVTRMLDLASEFSQIFWDDTPGPSQREGATSSRTSVDVHSMSESL